MKEVTYIKTLKKIDEYLSDFPIAKELIVEIIKESLEEKDYIKLAKKLCDIFNVNANDIGILLYSLENHSDINDFSKEVSIDTFEFLKLISITFGESLQDVRRFAFSREKLILNKTTFATLDKNKIGMQLKRIDGKMFYLELNLSTALKHTESILSTFREELDHNEIIKNFNLYAELVTQLRATSTFLHREITSVKRRGLDERDGITNPSNE